MIAELVLCLLLGIFAGIITGLTPGLHTNTLAVVLVALAPLMPFSMLATLAFLLSMSITHTFVSAIPSILLGAPDASMAVSALPGHKLFLEGRGLEAIWYTVVGSLCAVLLSLLFLPLLYLLFVYGYPLIKDYTIALLFAMIIFLFWRESRRLSCLILFVCSGFIGWSILHIEQLVQPLYLLFTGFFGVSLLWISLEQTSVNANQNFAFYSKINRHEILWSGILASVGGAIAAFLPGIGSAQIALLAQSFVKKISSELFLVLTGGINTANMFVSLMTFFVIEKARNGSIVALQSLASLDLGSVFVLFAVMLVAAGVAAMLVLPLSSVLNRVMRIVGEQRVTMIIIVFLIGLAFYFDSWLGICVLVVCMVFGMAVQRAGLPKHYLMGSLLIPVILYLL